MAFFTDMKRSLTETGKQVAQKTKELSDTVQLKTQLSREKEALNRQYAQIGKKVFEAANGADEETYTAEFTLIRESLKTIDELQDKLSTLEGFIHCPECGAKIEKASAFCSKCGAKIAETKPEDDDIDVVDTAGASETTREEKADGTYTCEAVPDESFETGSAETTGNITENRE
jgi:DNA-directed RNA polymerase subunit RPC12/RpoP